MGIQQQLSSTVAVATVTEQSAFPCRDFLLHYIFSFKGREGGRLCQFHEEQIQE